MAQDNLMLRMGRKRKQPLETSDDSSTDDSHNEDLPRLHSPAVTPPRVNSPSVAPSDVHTPYVVSSRSHSTTPATSLVGQRQRQREQERQSKTKRPRRQRESLDTESPTIQALTTMFQTYIQREVSSTDTDARAADAKARASEAEARVLEARLRVEEAEREKAVGKEVAS